MSDQDVVDARGYLCPQPLMMMVKKMKAVGNGEFEILVDNQTARENICRTAESRSWNVKENTETGDYFKIVLASRG